MRGELNTVLRAAKAKGRLDCILGAAERKKGVGGKS
jgi:hypothetical protein